MTDDSTLAATAALLHCLGTSNDIQFQDIGIPGANTPAKVALENEISALILRVQDLEAKAYIANNILPTTPNESSTPSAFADVLTGTFSRSNGEKSHSLRQFSNSPYPSSNFIKGKRLPQLSKLGTDELIEKLQKEIADQAEQIMQGKLRQQEIEAQMIQQAEHQQHLINQYEAKRVASLERELKKHQQANEAFQKALREIGEIITAVARGDLSKKVQIHSIEMDPEITTFKRVSLIILVKRIEYLNDLTKR